MNLLVTVPTYWRAPEDESGMYDHPTPIGERGTLPQLLDSLVGCEEKTSIAVIVGGTDPEIAEAAGEHVRALIEPYRGKFAIALFAMPDMRFLADRASAYGFSPDVIGLVGYGKIHNLQLLIGALLGVDAVIGLDDDEEVPSGYLSRAQRFIGSEYAGEPVLGVVGPYREAKEGLVVRSANPFLERGRWIKSGIFALATAPWGTLMDTPIGFGGNIVIHRVLFTHIPFDPYIPRGEDIDYIMTCRMHGRRFWWDNELFVYHSPPVQLRRSPCAMLRTDIVRFIYSREKINAALRWGLPSPGDLDPYPGRFLRDDLPELACDALTGVCPEEFGTKAEAKRFIEKEMSRARAAASEFFRIEDEWERLTTALAADEAAVEYVKEKLEEDEKGYG